MRFIINCMALLVTIFLAGDGLAAGPDESQEYEVAENEIYPGFYAEALFAETENDQVILRTKSPTVTFKSFSGWATDGLGCFGAEKTYSRDQFNSLIEQGKIQFTKEVGSDSQATPGCSLGSVISLEMFIDQQ